MIALGLILIVLAGLLVVGVLTGDGQDLTVDLFGVQLTTSLSGLFLAGVAAGAVAVLSLILLRVGFVTNWRQHQKVRELERRAYEAETREARAEPDEPVAGASRDSLGVDDDDGTGTGRAPELDRPPREGSDDTDRTYELPEDHPDQRR
jgi:hypothetical protein